MAPGQAVVRSEGGKKRLIIDYRGLSWGPDVAQFPQAMKDVLEKLQEFDADEIVLTEYYERIYNEEQTKLLKQVADLISSLEADAVWSPSHLGKSTETKVISPRHDAILRLLNTLHSDPFRAYLSLIQEIKSQVAKAASLEGEASDDLRVYLGTLTFMRQKMEKTDLIHSMKEYLSQLGSIPEGRAAYHAFFESSIKPSFIGSRIFFTGTEGLELVDQYDVVGTKVYIYKHPDKVEMLYYINPPEYSLPPDKYFLLEKTKEVVAMHRPDTVEFMDITQARKYFRKVYVATIADLALKNNINLSVEEKEELATIVARYTIGYGILEILLSDRKLTDVYIDSPLGVKPIYLVHGKYGQCQTNIIFSNEEARSIVSRFRALSGRPFDEAHPILDFDLEDLQTRIAVIGKPLALDGIAFALRLHKDTPWTLSQFVDGGMFSSFNAGMFSFFVDAQASMLIVGSRGAGKCLDGDSLIQMADGHLVKIRDLVESNLRRPTFLNDGCYEDCDGLEVLTLTPDLKIRKAKLEKVWRRSAPPNMLKINLASGKTITTTPEHPFFIMKEGFVQTQRADGILVGEHVATPRVVPVYPDKKTEFSLNSWKKQAVIEEDYGVKYAGCIPAVQSDLEELQKTTDLKQAASEMNLPYKSLLNLKSATRKSVSLVELLSLSRMTGTDIEDYLQSATGLKSNTSPHILPLNIFEKSVDADYGRFLGLLLGDGHVDATEIAFTNTNSTLLEEFGLLTERLFGIKGRIKTKKERSPDCLITSRTVSRFLSRRFGVPLGKKADVQSVPAELFVAGNDVVAAFLRGYFDCDSSVSKSRCEIEFSTASTAISQQVPLLLLRFGVLSSRRPKQVNGKTNYRIFIRGDNVKRYREAVGYSHPDKRQRLNAILEGAVFNSNIDVVPNAWALLSHCNHAYGIGTKSLDQKNVGRNKLARLSESILRDHALDPKVQQMHNLAHSDLFWDCVVKIEKVLPSEPFVYDLTVSGSHSFIANGVVAHNTSMLQALMLEIPQNLRILVQEDSVTGDMPILVQRNGRLLETTVGKLIDDLMKKHGAIVEDGVERLCINPDDIKVFSSSSAGMVHLAPVSRFIRHKTRKPIYLVKTQSGKKIKVTGDHSLFTNVASMIEPVKTSDLKVGDYLAVANFEKNSAEGTFVLTRLIRWEKVTSVEYLGPMNDYVYDFSVPGYENFVCSNILAHNTQELPVPALKRMSFNIQRLKTRPPLGGGTETEVSAEDALRTALRLGDSVLIVGEVRSGEAKALYEAMRVGAVGNVVMGTIHGESAYSIWDRVVNDLGVPTTSFKATDFCLVGAPIRFKGSLKRQRRVIELTEVLKHWETDPDKEDGMQPWLTFDANKDSMDFFEDQIKERSEWIRKVRLSRGLTYEDIMNEIMARGATKQHLVDQKRKFDIPNLIEAQYSVRAHNKYLLLSEKQREENGGVDHKALLADWRKWVDDTLVRDLVALKGAK